MNREEKKIKYWIENNLNYNSNNFETIQDLFMDYCKLYKKEYKEEHTISFSIYFSRVIKEKNWEIEKGKLNNKRGYFGLELFNPGTIIHNVDDFTYKSIQDKLENINLNITCLVHENKIINNQLDNLLSIYETLKVLVENTKTQDTNQNNINKNKLYNNVDFIIHSLNVITNTVHGGDFTHLYKDNLYSNNKTSITPVSTNTLLNTKAIETPNKKNKSIKSTRETKTTKNIPTNMNISSYISTYKPGNNKYETKDLYEDYKSFYKDQPNFLAYIPTVNQFKRKFEENWYKVYPNNEINTKARIGKNGKGISGLDKTN